MAEGEPATDIPHWNVCIFTPGNAPLAHLAQALTSDPRWVDSADAAAESSLASLLGTSPLGTSPLALAELYRQRADRFTGEALLLVVDQFEELFRYRQRNPDEADSFVKLLLRSAGVDLPIYVVMTMRSDFLGNAVAFHGLAEAINSGIYLTPRLGSEQIRSVITAQQLGVQRQSLETRAGARRQAPRRLRPGRARVHRARGSRSPERRDGRDVRRPQTLAELRAQVGNDAQDAQDALTVVIEAYRAQRVGFVLPAAGMPLQPDDLIDIGHESLIRRWQRFQTWLGEEDLDVAELREWLHRARRTEDRGGWLDQNDGDRALA